MSKTDSKTSIPNLSTPDASMEVDLRTLLLLIPEFDTTKNSQVYRFVRSCDSAFQLSSTPQQQILLTYTLNKITGPGSSDVHTKQFVTWHDLKYFLIQKYSQTKTLGHLHLELQSLFQKPNESITDYFHRVDLCRSKLVEKLTTEVSDGTVEGRVATTEETALNVFVNGLSSDIGAMLRVRAVTNLSDAGNFAIQEEKIRNMNGARQTLYRNSISSNQFRRTTALPPPTYQQTRTFQNTQRQQEPSVQNATKVCNYCKHPGHLISECRKRAYNNSMRQSSNTGQQGQQNRATLPARVNNLNSQAAEVQGIPLETASNYYSSAQTQISGPSSRDLNTETEALQLSW